MKPILSNWMRKGGKILEERKWQKVFGHPVLLKTPIIQKKFVPNSSTRISGVAGSL